MRDTIYDFAGIGLGPFNLSLACLAEPIQALNGIFLDKNPGFDWHPGMMLQDARLQTPFLSDLVTLADPTSRYSVLNYLKQRGKIYSFYIRQNFYLLRREYNQYCQWVTTQLPNLRFNTEVQHVEYDERAGCYLLHTLDTKSHDSCTYRARKLVLGTGTAPSVPKCCEPLMGRAVHSAHYLDYKDILQSKNSITVVGSGQSAAEIFFDLLTDIDVRGYTLNWITRSPRYFPLEYTKLTLEMTSPEYVDYFYNLPGPKRDQLNREQHNLYKGVNSDLINDIFDLIYTKRLSQDVKINLFTNSELQNACFDETTGSFETEFFHHEQERHYRHVTEGLILATGYRYRMPAFLKGISHRIRWDAQGRFAVHRNYSIDHNDTEIFVQNAELHTHGFVTPDLGMACYRNSIILRELTGTEYYPIEQKIAFQQFSAPTVPTEHAERELV